MSAATKRIDRLESLIAAREPTEPFAVATPLDDSDWRTVLRALFPRLLTHDWAPHHIAFWEWVWAMLPGIRPQPFAGVWPRGGGKSVSAEEANVVLGARRIRRYGVYISGTQEQANGHVETIRAMLESPEIEQYYPEMGSPQISKTGTQRAWRRNRLVTRGGFVVEAFGLDASIRGIRLDDQRPDFFTLDDIDDAQDTTATTEKKLQALIKNILPAGSMEDRAVLAIQNLVIPNGVFDQLTSDDPPLLVDRILSGPVPALQGIAWGEEELDDGRKVEIPIAGEPTWEGQDLEACRDLVLDIQRRAFEVECQHDVHRVEGAMWDADQFRYALRKGDPQPDPANPLPEVSIEDMDRTVCWVDPAVTDTDRSDANGIQIDGIKGQVKYRWFSWERRSSAAETLKTAISEGIAHGVQHVGVETDQGGDLWRDTYRQAAKSLGVTQPPGFRSQKAGAGYGPKTHRAQLMHADYERGRWVHVMQTVLVGDCHHGFERCSECHTVKRIDTVQILEEALMRFPLRKPFDVVDAAVWSFFDLNGGSGEIFYVPHPTRSKQPQSRSDDSGLSPQAKRHWREVEKAEAKQARVRAMIKREYGSDPSRSPRR